jgi:hypothetical protein
MQLNRCPVCHHRLSLEAICQDEAARELVGIFIGLNTDAGTALVTYLGLFRSEARDLSHDKALRLAKEVLALADLRMVVPALRTTVDNLQGKGGKPLANHNYLKKVLENYLATGDYLSAPEQDKPRPAPATSKTAKALQALEDFTHE